MGKGMDTETKKLTENGGVCVTGPRGGWKKPISKTAMIGRIPQLWTTDVDWHWISSWACPWVSLRSWTLGTNANATLSLKGSLLVPLGL